MCGSLWSCLKNMWSCLKNMWSCLKNMCCCCDRSSKSKPPQTSPPLPPPPLKPPPPPPPLKRPPSPFPLNPPFSPPPPPPPPPPSPSPPTPVKPPPIPPPIPPPVKPPPSPPPVKPPPALPHLNSPSRPLPSTFGVTAHLDDRNPANKHKESILPGTIDRKPHISVPLPPVDPTGERKEGIRRPSTSSMKPSLPPPRSPWLDDSKITNESKESTPPGMADGELVPVHSRPSGGKPASTSMVSTKPPSLPSRHLWPDNQSTSNQHKESMSIMPSTIAEPLPLPLRRPREHHNGGHQPEDKPVNESNEKNASVLEGQRVGRRYLPYSQQD